MKERKVIDLCPGNGSRFRAASGRGDGSLKKLGVLIIKAPTMFFHKREGNPD